MIGMPASFAATTVETAPFIALPVLIGLGAVSVALLSLSILYYRRGVTWRSAITAAFFIALLNPSLKVEQRQPIPGVATIVVDHSPSQDFGQRRARTDAALAYLRDKVRTLPGLELRVIDSAAGTSSPARETLLFGKLDEALADVPLARRAGVVFLTDGEVHDVPADPRLFGQYGPVNVLLSGDHSEHDRQLIIREAPAYGIVGQDVQITYRIADPDAEHGDTVPLTIHQDNVTPQTIAVPANTDQMLTVHIAHAGQNVVDLTATAGPKELTLANNRVPVIINGVRDRLRVLLVSGQPYAGGRTWRNLLTSDPGVDLVHFTIMRNPEKFDPTPQNDLSLIAFPFDELFKTKLYSFDLIIFDRYQTTHILPDYYFANIARYVQDGGALLVTDGPAPFGQSLYNTSLQSVLSAPPDGRVLEQPFKPQITDIGQRHPVTQGLGPVDGSGWGNLLRQTAVTPAAGVEVVMTGADKLPLLILSHVGKGRVAQLASDEIWLWSRGYDGGGPQGELLRRLAHWLMKEPELEENALEVSAGENGLLIRRHALKPEPMTVTITAPDGSHSQAILKPAPNGLLTAQVAATQLGVYVVNDGTQERFALVGAMNPPELASVRTTADKLLPLVHASGGAVNWLADHPQPDVRLLTAAHRSFGGTGWFAFRDGADFIVMGTRGRPLLPAWLLMGGLLFLLAAGWWREGRR